MELRDFTVIHSDVRLTGNGSLIPTAGALVINVAENISYVPTRIRGLPFISWCRSPHQTFNDGAASRNEAFSNCIFYGSVLIDAQASPLFQNCVFIGVNSDNGAKLVHTRSPAQHSNQSFHCDFFRLGFLSPLPIAGSEHCWFGQCGIGDIALPVQRPVTVSAWDSDGAISRICQASPSLTLHLLNGRPETPLGYDTPGFAAYLDHLANRLIPQVSERLKK